MKLYEFTAMISVATVVAANSREEAETAIRAMSEQFFVSENGNADVLEVSDIEFSCERDPAAVRGDEESVEEWLEDEAHLIVGDDDRKGM